MSDFRFSHAIEVRYADIDAQGHVNNVVYFTYMEQARARYLEHLGLWDGKDFNALGIILAEASCTYRAPIRYGQAIDVGVRAARLGKRSFDLVYTVRDAGDGREMASGRTVVVAYDYTRRETIPIPEAWRRAIEAFEGIAPSAEAR
ncbi:MAG: thioesterase family protein [Chloroflexota bacterium]